MIKETSDKQLHSSIIKESQPRSLDISFTKIMPDDKFGLLSSSSATLNDKKKIQKIIKTLILIREKKPHELIQAPKQNEIGGCEKCNIDRWQWQDGKVKSFLSKITQNQIFIIRAGDSRIFGSIDNNCFYIHAIEYKLGDAYKH